MRILSLTLLSASALVIASCGAVTADGPDLGQVLDRTVYVLDYYSENSDNKVADDVTDEDLNDFTGLMQRVMNAEPPFYDKPVGVAIEADATFSGFIDNNMDNIQDSGETEIFTVEIDAENNRLIATDTVSGQATSVRSAATGFIAGALIGRLMGRQRAAGINRGAFNSRNVQSRADYNKTRPAPKRSSARSKSRSGSSRGGK